MIPSDGLVAVVSAAVFPVMGQNMGQKKNRYAGMESSYNSCGAMSCPSAHPKVLPETQTVLKKPSSASFPYQDLLIYGFTSNRHRSSLQKTIRRNYFIVPVFGTNKGDLMFSSDFFMHPDNDTEKYA